MFSLEIKFSGFFPIFIYFILVRGVQRLSGDFRAKLAREGVCRRGSMSTLTLGFTSRERRSAEFLSARTPRSLSSFCFLTNYLALRSFVLRCGEQCNSARAGAAMAPRPRLVEDAKATRPTFCMALRREGAENAGRRQKPRERRGRAAARKRAHLRGREAQRAQARRRFRDPWAATRKAAGHVATGVLPAHSSAQVRTDNFRVGPNAVGPPRAYPPRARRGEMWRQLCRPQ